MANNKNKEAVESTEEKAVDSTKGLEAVNKENELEAKLKEIDEKIAILDAKAKEYEDKKQELESTISTFTQTKEIDKKTLEKESLSIGQTLARENKVTIVIPKSELNPLDQMVPVTINGYTYSIKRGERVTVPETVYEILKESKYI